MSAPVIRFGAAYYAEYQRRPDVAADLDLMAGAGFSVIRVGESVWSTWEPQDGRFELDWLEPVLDAAHERDISVKAGYRVHVLHNWSWAAAAATVPDEVTDLLTGESFPPGARLALLPWDVRILRGRS